MNSLLVLLLNDLSIAGASVALFTSLWVVSTPREGKGPDRLLALLLFLFAVNVLHPLVSNRGGIGWQPVLEPLQFFLPLGFLWYLRSLSAERWWGAEILILVLPLGFTGLALWGAPPLTSLAFWVSLVVTAGLLFIPLSLQLHRYRDQLKARYSNLRGVDASWLGGVLQMLWLIFGLYALCLTLILHAPVDFPFRPALSASMGLLGLYLSWKALRRNTRMAEGLREDTQEKTAVASEDHRNTAARLKALIVKEQLYKNSELTLDELAARSGLSRHDVSAALNQGLGTSFYELINGFRVEEFQRLCQQKAFVEEKLLTLAFAAGFNSKPTFNLVFKKATGLTPSVYRQRQKIASHPNG